MTSLQETQKKDIRIVAILHNDIPQSKRKTLYADYFQPLVKELESFTGRKVDVIFKTGEPHSSFYYKRDPVEAMELWIPFCNRLMEIMEEEEGYDFDDELTKFILVTNNALDGGTYGVASMDLSPTTGTAAIASLETYSCIGHEIGHLLGATHDDSEILFNGWFAETYVVPQRNNLRSNSYTFSSANRQNILNYLADKD
ncbi:MULTISPECIES: reprolysin-like metallopeptidase [unclassified Pseudomonas]|jgi:hypothetical protein|uniref:reprolysin-like metallopeptidase n=1 Tax=unclassified Pseudomonas TaxID=196821 RepID=UPI002892A368|nr:MULTISPECIES: hypothetical protein [unclassified Pseudomonas]